MKPANLTESKGKNIGKFIIKEYALIFFVIILALAFTAINPKFIKGDNLENMLRQASINAIISLGLLFPIITGGIDLSVGAVSGIAGVLVAGFMRDGMPPLQATIAVLIIGAAIGAFNGFLITKMNIPPFIATMATMTIVDGIKYIYSHSLSIFIESKSFAVLGGGSFLNIAIPIWIMILITVILEFTMLKTVFGRSLYALGGNREAAKLAGINTGLIILLAYVVGAFFSAFSGIILASRLAVGSPLAGNTYVNNAIASVVIGGGSLSGGLGKPSMVLFGAFVIAMVGNFLNLMGIQNYVQRVIIGSIIIIAVFFSEKGRTKR